MSIDWKYEIAYKTHGLPDNSRSVDRQRVGGNVG